MPLIHHVIAGPATRPVVFVHGFGCGLTDWDSQVAHLSPRHQTIAVDLPGHGSNPGAAADCSIERYGADVAELMRALSLSPSPGLRLRPAPQRGILRRGHLFVYSSRN